MIVIPMAGLSSRFKAAGYDKPKYMLEARGRTLFEHSVDSFRYYFPKERFVFITLESLGAEEFIETKCRSLGVEDFSIATLGVPSGGQAETAYLGLRKSAVSPVEPITIFNIDTFRPNFRHPELFDLPRIGGYLETFIGSGENWSNVIPLAYGSDRVKGTAEKKMISEFCCTGLYYWTRAGDFMDIFEELKATPVEERHDNEYYIAPMYNQLIARGGDVRFCVIERDEVIFCGVPQEYQAITRWS